MVRAVLAVYYFQFLILGLLFLIRLEVLRALVGHIPPHPLWAELLWQRQDEMTKRMTAAQQSFGQTSPTTSRPLQQR
jgi:hypothetical protein